MLLLKNAIKCPHDCVAHTRDAACLRSKAQASPPAAPHNNPDESLSTPALLVLDVQAHYFVSCLSNCAALAGTPTRPLLAALVVQILAVNLYKIEN